MQPVINKHCAPDLKSSNMDVLYSNCFNIDSVWSSLMNVMFKEPSPRRRSRLADQKSEVWVENPDQGLWSANLD